MTKIPNILKQIVADKKQEIANYYKKYSIEDLKKNVCPSDKSFYDLAKKKKAANEYFFITEFKRKSPSEGWINRSLDIFVQVDKYVRAGANVISVLTDEKYFGGTYNDLKTVANFWKNDPVLFLQKDFVIDPIQVYLARQHGANLILLIAAILEPKQLDELKQLAESLGMGVLVEVHDFEEYEKIKHLDFPVLGVNNRDLKTFKVALNRCNYVASKTGAEKVFIAESGMLSYRDFHIAKTYANGFLIGTSLMRNHGFKNFKQFFKTDQPYLFKACGIRKKEHLKNQAADWIGINFSPVSKRKVDEAVLEGERISESAVAVFKQNSEEDIQDIIQQYHFKCVQLYGDDVSLEFVKSLKQKIFLAYSLNKESDIQQLEQFAPYVDVFILDGTIPGSGQKIGINIPESFPYPFLLAGGMNKNNLEEISKYKNCIGVDIASGIETTGKVDENKIQTIKNMLVEMTKENKIIVNE